MHPPENIERREEKEWQRVDKVDASFRDRFPSDKGFRAIAVVV